MLEFNNQLDMAQIDSQEEPGNSLQRYCLRWGHYQTNLTNVFDQLLQNELLVDVTLACDGHILKAHKIVLSACSPYFQKIFSENPCEHPIVIMEDIGWLELKAAIEFMYKGEINVFQHQIDPLLNIANSLQIKGLTNIKLPVNDEVTSECEFGSDLVTNPSMTTSRKRRYSTRSSRSKSTPSEPAVKQPDVKTEPIDDIEIEQDTKEIAEEAKEPFHHCKDQPKSKWPWSNEQLQSAIQSVVTQRMRFTQASAHYNIPKGTLYDNILGKSKRMLVLEEAGLTHAEERKVLEFCCEISKTPYNKKTQRPLPEILDFVEKLRRKRSPAFKFIGLSGFRWWWAFCKKNCILSLYYDFSSPETTSLT